MLALLLAAAAAGPVYLPPQVSVPFPGTTPSLVMGPGSPNQAAEFRWYHQQTLYSPAKTAAGVRFCQDYGKFSQCEVWLIRPGQPHQRLANSNVTRLLWTKDGKYLIGAGTNAVRLWNLVGGMRTAVPQAVAPIFDRRGFATIQQLRFQGRDLCVSVDQEVFINGHLTNSVTATVRYALPTLKPLTVTTLGSTPNEKAKEAECRPSTSSDL